MTILLYFSLLFHAAGTSMDIDSSIGRRETNPLLTHNRIVYLKAGNFALAATSQTLMRQHPKWRKVAIISNFALGSFYTGAAIHNWRIKR